MDEKFEQKIQLQYLRNMLRFRTLSPGYLDTVIDFLEEWIPAQGFELPESCIEQNEAFRSALRDSHTRARREMGNTRQGLLDALERFLKKLGRYKTSSLSRNIELLTQDLGLSPMDKEIFSFMARYRYHESFKDFLESLTRHHIPAIRLMGVTLGLTPRQLQKSLENNAPLLAGGLLHPGSSSRKRRDIDDCVDVPEFISNALQKIIRTKNEAKAAVFGEPNIATLSWEDFDYIEDKERLLSFLTAAIKQKLPGVNILLWGPPGTGKTEFCKTLAAKLGASLYSVCEEDSDGDEPNKAERITSLKLAQNLLRFNRNNLLVFDEMDDMFQTQGLAALFGGKFTSGSKVFTNRLFENNPIPTLWITNNADCLDEAVVRRMSLAMEIAVPPERARQRLLKRMLDAKGFHLEAQHIKTLAQLDTSPAVTDNAVRFAQHTGQKYDDILFAAQGITQVIRGKKILLKDNPDEGYRPELLNASTDLAALSKRILSLNEKAFSLCLYGPPGTGKSAYVRYLAQQMDMPVLLKRASDLISKFLGESEKNIAEAFEEAKRKEAFLIFDEADSLLQDRRKAVRSWEISQVNEMLTWMESHPLPFACTTNLMESLDKASLRRFTFKCGFDYLSPEQIEIAWKHFFQSEISKQTLSSLSYLTPGDFAVVRKRLKFLDIHDESDIAGLLLEEIALKDIAPNRRIGFNA